MQESIILWYAKLSVQFYRHTHNSIMQSLTMHLFYICNCKHYIFNLSLELEQKPMYYLHSLICARGTFEHVIKTVKTIYLKTI